MGVVNVIVDMSRQAAVRDEAFAWAAPINYQALPSQEPSLTGNPLAPPPPADAERPTTGSQEVFQKENSQGSSFSMRSDDPRPWAKYL